MNPNSFSSGELAPGQQNGRDAAEFPSFEEHMNSVKQHEEKGSLIDRAKKALDNLLSRRKRIEHNMNEFNKPTLKNATAFNSMDVDYSVAPAVETVFGKLHEGEPLNGHDIMGMVARNFAPEETEEIFNEIGINNGINFDVDLPKHFYNSDGSLNTTPLMVSFENTDGSFTQIGISTGEDSVCLYAGRGKREGADVSYRNNRRPYSPENDLKVFKTVAFDFAGRTLVNKNTEK